MNHYKIHLTLLLICVINSAFSQVKKDSIAREMDEIVVSGSRFEEAKKKHYSKN